MSERPAIGILGTLQLWNDDGEVPLRGTKLRMLLTRLCLDAGRAVPTDEIRQVLWGEQPPPTADNAVQVHMATLRRVLGSLDGEISIETVPHGYRLVAPAGTLDRDEFLRARTDAQDAVQRRLRESAAAHFRAALGLWRGPALGEFADTEGFAIRARELDRLELDTFEAFADNELALGRHHELVPVAERRARQHPLRESLWAILALSLYRDDQQAEALEALRTVRAALDDELGVEPGDRLQSLEVAILRREAVPTAEAEPAPTTLGAERTVTDVRSDIVSIPLRLELPGGDEVVIDRPAVVLGRDAACDVVLARPSVSGRHARITSTAHGHVIEDLLSTNGTYVNGEAVARRVLVAGDVIELGRLPVRYAPVEVTPRPTPPG